MVSKKKGGARRLVLDCTFFCMAFFNFVFEIFFGIPMAQKNNRITENSQNCKKKIMANF